MPQNKYYRPTKMLAKVKMKVRSFNFLRILSRIQFDGILKDYYVKEEIYQQKRLFNFIQIVFMLIMKENSQSLLKPKYTKLFTPQQLQLFDYESITEENQFQFVYKPNDDTFLILSTLKHELPTFKQDLLLCQIGSGSGIISANLHKWLKQQGKAPLLHISIDINMDASLLSQKHYNKYNLNIQQINTSIFNNLAFSLPISNIKPQIIVFNPPYVPVEQEEIDNEHKYLVQKLKYVREKGQCVRKQEQNLIAYSYMGGLDGLLVTKKILANIVWCCSIYFIVMGQEGVSALYQQVKAGSIFQSNVKVDNFQVLQYEQFYNQHLFVIMIKLQTENK